MKKWEWTSMRVRNAVTVSTAVAELKEYWPVTVKQIFHQLAAKNLIFDTDSQYEALSQFIEKMRSEGLLKEGVISDVENSGVVKVDVRDLVKMTLF